MWVFVIVRSAGVRTVAVSLALSFDVFDWPPPLTVAVFMIELAALDATSTFSVIAG